MHQRDLANENLTNGIFAFRHGQNHDLVTRTQRDVAMREDDLAVTNDGHDCCLTGKAKIFDHYAIRWRTISESDLGKSR